MNDTIVISAFPGTGKSYVKNNNTDKNMIILDSDSSMFSWITTRVTGETTRIRNCRFPDNYIEHIRNNIGTANIIFVSSHDIVRDALKENEIKFISIYPNINLLDEYIERYKARGNDASFINFIKSNWVKFIDKICKEDDIKYQLESGEYISDRLNDIIMVYNNAVK